MSHSIKKDINQKRELLEAVQEGFNGYEIPASNNSNEVSEEKPQDQEINWLKAHPVEVPNKKQLDKEKRCI